jgi:pre-60S factor REI1
MQQVQHDYIVLSPEYEDFYEGELMDPEEEAPEPDAKGNQLVLVDASKTLFKRRADGIQKKFPRESAQQAEQRRAITAASHEASALILKERREAAAPERKKELNRQRQQSWIQNKAQMQLGVRTNKLHPKGYDGEGETN